MKYIKLFENYNDIEQLTNIMTDIHGIFIDLIDDDYEIIPNVSLHGEPKYIRVSIGCYNVLYRGRFSFIYEDIADKVDMFLDYIRNEYGYIEVEYTYDMYSQEGEGYRAYPRQKSTKAPELSAEINHLRVYAILDKKESKFKKFIKRFI